MNNIQIYIIVEGQTEQTFVRDILAPHMAHKGIYLSAALIGKPGHKGGNISFDRAKTDIGNFLRQRQDIYISTMFDYYRIDNEWPGRDEIQRQIQNGNTIKASEKAEILEMATHVQIVSEFPGYDSENRFISYIEMHEFEALLFSDARVLAENTGIDLMRIEGILQSYTSPEEINDDPEKTPSKRLIAAKNGYRKVAMGKKVAESIGIQAIRTQCRHFDDWLKKLETIVK